MAAYLWASGLRTHMHEHACLELEQDLVCPVFPIQALARGLAGSLTLRFVTTAFMPSHTVGAVLLCLHGCSVPHCHSA